MGDDLRVVNAARVSFAKESKMVDSDVEEPISSPAWYQMTGQRLYIQELSEPDKKLVSYLAKHGHWTPFAHPQITIREKVPIFVARQRFKHMVGFVYNEVSRRYVDDDPEFWSPYSEEWKTDTFRKRPESSVKQGSSEEIVDPNERFEMYFIGDEGEYEKCYFTASHIYTIAMEVAEDAYRALLKAGVAPELARAVLPQSTYTEYYVTGSLAAWARAYKQRIDPHAQKEIRELAMQWDKIISPLFPVSWKALTQ